MQQTKILASDEQGIAQAAEALRRGEVVAIPTETVYGLAGAAFDSSALATIFSVKERPTFDPLICHVRVADSAGWLSFLEAEGLVLPERLSRTAQWNVQQLGEAFWPGPLTLVLPKSPRVPDLATSGLTTVGIRCPQHPVAQALLDKVRFPLAAPSANRFGRISPTCAAHVLSELEGRIPFILDGGECEIGLESTVLRVDPEGGLTLFRPGAISMEAIAEVCGAKVTVSGESAMAPTGPLPSPGLLARHYAPQKRMQLLEPGWRQWSLEVTRLWINSLPREGVIGLLLCQGSPAEMAQRLEAASTRRLEIRSLSVRGDVAEAARNLFSTLRDLDDHLTIQTIFAERMPADTGLAHAINNRLQRACHD